MTIESDRPVVNTPDGKPSDDFDAAEILARYWNDRETMHGNIETISWWLRQSGERDLGC